MKHIFLFSISIFFSGVLHSQEWKTIFSKEIRPEGLSAAGKVVFEFDTTSGSRSRARFIYSGKNSSDVEVKVECPDSSFESKYSSTEFKQILKSLITNCLQNGLADDNPDKTIIADQLPVIVGAIGREWYDVIQNELEEKENKVQSNVGNLSYNDSLMANLLINCKLKVYKEIFVQKPSITDTIRRGTYRIKTITKESSLGAVNTQVAEVPVTNIKVQINDGFIYSFSFDIITDGLSGEMKQILRPHQSFSLRYNLRHNILSKGLIDDKPAVYLKRNHTSLHNSRSEYVFFPGEFFNYQSPLAAVNTVFTARDTIISYAGCVISKMPDSIKLKEKSLYSIINLDVFGDFIGFFDNNKPNGLLQTELKANFYGFRKPFGQRLSTRARFTMLNKGELFFRLSKLDDKNRFLSVLTDSIRNVPGQNDTIVKYVHGYRLLEYQNIYAGLRFNVGEVEFRGGSLAFTGEATFLRTPLQDTIFKTVQEQNRIDTVLTPIDYGKSSLIIAPGINIKVLAASFCDIDIKGKVFFIHPLTKKIRTSFTEFDEFYGGNSFKKITTTKLYNFGVQFTLNLNNEKSRRVIFRGDTYIDTKTRGNNFMQLQIGYSADLNKFISLNNPAKN